MRPALSSRLTVAALAMAALAGCTTPHAKPKVSQAVLDARAHRDEPAANACPQTTLAQASPVFVGYAFDAVDLTEAASEPLADAARWLTCHAAVAVVIRPDADVHGTDAEQNALAARRAETVRTYLTAHGVAAGRIRVLARGAAEPPGEHMLIRAEGRRW
jgi:outer membrane protein OmpA-like peptidoglycan-associated protein